MKDKKKFQHEESHEEVAERPGLVAKKDFTICHNSFFLAIKAGDDLSGVPSIFLENLKTEGVI
jgi:hypothetical protein